MSPGLKLSMLLVVLSLGAGPTDPLVPAGKRVELGVEGAKLFVPEGYQPGAGGAVDVLLHLHGAPSVLEPAVATSGWKGVLVSFNRKGLSRVYTEPFSDPELFPKLIEATRIAIRHSTKGSAEPKIGRVYVSSFSAGFGGVRELLKTPRHFERIDGLIMLDSIYCGYGGDVKYHQPDPQLMAGFRQFALEAAAGRKWFLISHSEQVPGAYASTTETADYLIKCVGGQSRQRSVEWAKDWRLSRESATGRFIVLGFAGSVGADHMKHLRHVDQIWTYFLKKVGDG